MQNSAEMRWFAESTDELSSVLTCYNEQGKHFNGKRVRSDLYLLVKNMTTHGIKIREGKMEIKALLHEWGDTKINDAISGKANRWCKYQFTYNDDEPDAKEIMAAFTSLRAIGINQHWIRIDKERLLVAYAIDPDNGMIRIAGENERPGQGCNIELTRIQINLQKEYYTFCLEAFGKGVDVKKHLDITAAQVLGTRKISGLAIENSMSYPEFLARYAGVEV